MPLSDVKIRTAKPQEKNFKLYDERGLFLIVTPAGGKWWRFRYKWDSKEKLLSLGTYPDVSLKEARGKRDEVRNLLANDIDPGEHRKITKNARIERVANSFKAVALEWFIQNRDTWAKSHADKIIRLLGKDVFPWLGSRPITEITAPEILAVLRRIAQRGANDTAHRTKGNISQVMRYAIATGRAERDPVPDLRGALPPTRSKNFATITDPEKVGELLRAMDGFRGSFPVQCALRLAPLLFVRPGELRQAQWKDIDLDKAEWNYFVTKTRTQHSVPLATQAVAILTELHPLTGHKQYVFLGGHDPKKAMSEAAINAALRRMGSHRARINATLSHSYSKAITFNVGAGYEYEFDARAKATTYGIYSIDAPSAKGGTGIVSLDANVIPGANQNLSLDFNLNGYMGKREGFGAMVRVNYAF